MSKWLFHLVMHETADVEVEADTLKEAYEEAFPEEGSWGDVEFQLDYSELDRVEKDGRVLNQKEWSGVG